MPAALGILADDLTGAADSAVPFSARGLRAVVALPGHPDWPDDADVISIDTDSRALLPSEAEALVHAAAELLTGRGVSRWFKKVDSTLRGNVGAELTAALKAGGRRLAVLAPAFPAHERRVRDGTLLVGRPESPTSTADIAALLASQGQSRVSSVGLAVVEQGPQAVAASLRALGDSEPTVAVVDALDDAHLRTIARASQLLGQVCLLAGSGGLSAALAALEPPVTRAATSTEPPVRHVLVLVGSLNPRTRDQLDYARQVLAAEEISSLSWVQLARRKHDADAWERVVGAARQTLEHQSVLVLATDIRGPGAERPGESRAPVEALASIAAALIRTTADVGVVASGGDSIAALCRELGGGLLDLRGEVLTGMPRATLLDGERPGLPLVTKAGGFGPLNALELAVRSLWTGG